MSLDNPAPAPKSLTDRFREIYRGNLWKHPDTVSGAGSSAKATVELIPQLQELLRRLGVRILVDAACGDAGWITPVIAETPLYAGFDVVPELIEQLATEEKGFGGRAQFALADICVQQLPRADLILCRDCLVHLSDDLAIQALGRIAASRGRWLLATTFPDVEDNLPGSVGGWRPVNLTLAPFNLPPPVELLVERPSKPANSRHGRKALGLWSLESLKEALPAAPAPAEVLMLRPPGGLAGKLADLELTPLKAAAAAEEVAEDGPGLDLWAAADAWAVAPELTAPSPAGGYVLIEAEADGTTALEVQLLRRRPGADSGPFSWYSLHRGAMAKSSWLVNLDHLFAVDGFEPSPGDRLILRFKGAEQESCGIRLERLELLTTAAATDSPAASSN